MEIRGIIAPILTPMREDESIYEEQLRLEVDWLIRAGMHRIFPCGTNGEGYILSAEEKLRVIRVCVEQAAGRVPVYAGTGCISTRETVELSLRAQEAGADALSDSEGLVVFTSRCWKSDRGFYNRFTQTFTPAAGVTMTQEEQDSYVAAMKKLVGYKLDSTAMIVENDFYHYAFGNK